MKLRGLIVLLVPALLAAAAQPGDPAPAIQFDKLIPDQPVASVGFDALRGKAVVLEFWATWCGPCVDAIPHLNKLTEQFKSRPIAFISLTDEDPAVVEPFLKKRPIDGIVGIAHKQSAWKAYGVQGIPTTFLINPEGKIVGTTHPDMLKPELLEDLIAGKALTLPKQFQFTVSSRDREGGPPPLLDMLIRPASGGATGMGSGRDRLTMQGYSIRGALVFLYQTPVDRVTGSGIEDPTRYDFSFAIPKVDDSTFHSLVRDAVIAAFHLKVTPETRDTDVWVLGKLDKKPDVLKETDYSGMNWSSGNGTLKMTGGTMERLAGALESVLQKPVIDESGLPGKYDIELSYDRADSASAVAALRKAGFTIESARRPIEFLVVTRQQ